MAKNSKKKHEIWIVLVCIIFGLYAMIVMPIVHAIPDYERLISEEIVVESVGNYKVLSGRGSYDEHYIKTVDGEVFYIRGLFSFEKLKEELIAGTEAEIKYYRGAFGFLGLSKRNYLNEMTIDGVALVEHYGDNMAQENQIAMMVVGGIIILYGGFLYAARKGVFDRRKKKRKKN